jgi:hypothetical protein
MLTTSSSNFSALSAVFKGLTWLLRCLQMKRILLFCRVTEMNFSCRWKSRAERYSTLFSISTHISTHFPRVNLQLHRYSYDANVWCCSGIDLALKRTARRTENQRTDWFSISVERSWQHDWERWRSGSSLDAYAGGTLFEIQLWHRLS